MNARILSITFGLMFGAVAFATAAQDPIVLIAGVGIRGGLQIGDRSGVADGWNEIRIQNKEDKDLVYRTNAERRVIAIRCRKNACVTDMGVRVGMGEKDVLRRYGAPRKDRRTSQGVYFEYPGVGFDVVNGTVASIYVYAHAAR